MATPSSVFAWRIPGTGEPGGLPYMGSHRVGHDGSDLAAAGSSKLFSTVVIPFFFSIVNGGGFLFLYICTHTCYFLFFSFTAVLVDMRASQVA